MTRKAEFPASMRRAKKRTPDPCRTQLRTCEKILSSHDGNVEAQMDVNNGIPDGMPDGFGKVFNELPWLKPFSRWGPARQRKQKDSVALQFQSGSNFSGKRNRGRVFYDEKLREEKMP